MIRSSHRALPEDPQTELARRLDSLPHTPTRDDVRQIAEDVARSYGVGLDSVYDEYARLNHVCSVCGVGTDDLAP